MTIKDITRHFLNIGTYKGLINADIWAMKEEINKQIVVLNFAKDDIKIEEIEQMGKDEISQLIERHNSNLKQCILNLENNINEYEELLKKRYMEFGAILYEIENEYI